jgi:hypothetical protein
MRSFGIVWTGVLLFLLVAASPPSHADTFQAPTQVVANLDGSFSYQAKFRKEGTADQLGGNGWYGVANVAGGYSADCFCESFCTMQAGDSLTIQVNGQLTDPTQQGSAGTEVTFCTPGMNYGALTTVHPYGTTGVGEPAPPPLLLWNAPNPATPRTMLHWVLPTTGPVRLRVFDLAGRQVASLVDEVQSSGHHQMIWDARTEARFGGGGGVYFARLSMPGQSLTRMIIVRR